MKKGISAIIATILLLMIMISLAGLAYLYVTSMLSARTAKVITLTGYPVCNSTYHITFAFTNDGTQDIDTSTDITVLVDDVAQTFVFNPTTVSPRQSATASGGPFSSGSHSVLVVTPSNSVRGTVYC